jgi:hypothetical protein
MELPNVSHNDFQEREGVFAVALSLSRLGLIFRETPNTDVGIDGQVEYVSNNKAIGKVIAVQIKSGESYLIDRGDHYAFYLKEKHLNYWESFPLPVVILLHDPKTQRIYFSDVRYYLSIPEKEQQYKYIPVPKSPHLDDASKQDLFQLPGIADGEFLDMPDLLNKIVNSECSDRSFPVTYFELFVNGLTNLCRHSFFSMQVALDVAEYNMHKADPTSGIGVGRVAHNFLHDYVRFLISQNLVQVNYSDYLIDWKERELQPNYLSPLTARGRAPVAYIRETENDLFADKGRPSVACERAVQMVYMPSDEHRFDRINSFSNLYLEKKRSS